LAYIDLKAAAIANGAALSPAVPLGEKTLVGIVMPAVWTTAAITFQVSVDDATFNELYDGAGNATSVKARSGTSASPVNQGQASVLQLVTRAVY
jgi:hypothetical protein